MLEFLGLYVSRNTYIRAGIAEWKISNPVHIVCFIYFQLWYSLIDFWRKFHKRHALSFPVDNVYFNEKIDCVS